MALACLCLQVKIFQHSRSPDTREFVSALHFQSRSHQGLNWRWLAASNMFVVTTASFTSNGWNTLQGTVSDRSLKGDDIRENEYSFKSELNVQLSRSLEIKAGGMVGKSVHAHYGSSNITHPYRASDIGRCDRLIFRHGDTEPYISQYRTLVQAKGSERIPSLCRFWGTTTLNG